MANLVDIYNHIQNPLNDKKLVQQLIEEYSKTSRADLWGNDLYKSIVNLNHSTDSTSVNLKDKEIFYIEAYNQWINNVLNLNTSQAKVLKSAYNMDIKELQTLFSKVGSVKSFKDIYALKSHPLLQHSTNNWELDSGGWEHIKSRYISSRKEPSIDIKHRLYVGCKNEDIWKVAKLFKNKCEHSKVPFYFKLQTSSNRDDKIVIYADTDNLGNYIDFLQEIQHDNPDIVNRCGPPPTLTGKIDGWIGIGDEPPKKANGELQSYNTLRADIIDYSIEDVIITDLINLENKNVKYNNKEQPLNDLFIQNSTKVILNKLHKAKDIFQKYGISGTDLSNPNFIKYIKKHMKDNIPKGLVVLNNTNSSKDQLTSSNYKNIFNIPTRNNKSIGINTYDMDTIIKSMVPVLQQVDTNFNDKIKSKIIEVSKQNGIDDTFCFQQNSLNLFKQITQNNQVCKTSQNTKSNNPIRKRNLRKVKTQNSSLPVVQKNRWYDKFLNWFRKKFATTNKQQKNVNTMTNKNTLSNTKSNPSQNKSSFKKDLYVPINKRKLSKEDIKSFSTSKQHNNSNSNLSNLHR